MFNFEKLKRKKVIAVVVLLFIIAVAAVILFLNYRLKKKIFYIPDIKERSEIAKAQEIEKNAVKKNKGKIEDKNGAEITAELSGNIIDYKQKLFPELSIMLKDESGIYKIAYEFYIKDKKIGVIYNSLNSKKKKIKVKFVLNEKIVLDNLKSLKEYEGEKIDIKIVAEDNNNNINSYMQKGLKIIDNTAPETPEFFWTFYPRTIKPGVVIYNRDRKNKFILKPVKDLPYSENNKIKEYEYGIKNIKKEIVYKTKIKQFEESATDLNIELERDGKYYFFVRAYDLNDNYSEKELLFGVDKIQPFVDLNIAAGQKFEIKEIVDIDIKAVDNESGLDKMRVACSKAELLKTEWMPYSKSLRYQLPDKEGLYDLWCEVKDIAGNSSDYAKYSFYLYRDKNIKIKSSSKEMESKEKVMRVNQESNMNIESAEER